MAKPLQRTLVLERVERAQHYRRAETVERKHARIASLRAQYAERVRRADAEAVERWRRLEHGRTTMRGVRAVMSVWVEGVGWVHMGVGSNG